MSSASLELKNRIIAGLVEHVEEHGEFIVKLNITDQTNNSHNMLTFLFDYRCWVTDIIKLM